MKRVSLTPAVFHLPEKVNAIAREYGKQPIVPRGPLLKPILDRVRSKLVSSIGAADSHEAVIFTSAGSGAIAAAMGSCVDERGILIVSNGAYGERQVAFAEQLDLKVVHYALEYGEKPDLEQIEALVQKEGVGALGLVYGATSTCSVNPVNEIGALAHRLNLRFIVDGISAIYVEELDLKEAHIDVLISSVNKGLHAPPGMGFVIVEKSYLNLLAKQKAKIPYFDIGALWKKQASGGHLFTIDPRSLLETEAALDDLEARGGVSARIATYQERTQLLREGYKKLGLRIFEKEGMPLENIGTALYLPEGIEFEALSDLLANWEENDECYEIYSAQGALSDKVFRIFNMGDYDLDTYRRFLHALEVCLNKLSK
ncbi:MAG: 2-aminoethylphosphonate--pyruvate aminotransferase [SAR324 cluster bacterium]|uniref:2-aminoethylphosphonate--pyruvate aminotransferase n=1 Tax=SAR324 cluster bacterium TaxID=2024889 RepID=A0A2A4T7W1_9DELT|nr:MAG: 2-aminoethylphosphonate--pyruvate aminotransferase [SAR324 cluster bacterium]